MRCSIHSLLVIRKSFLRTNLNLSCFSSTGSLSVPWKQKTASPLMQTSLSLEVSTSSLYGFTCNEY